MIFSCKMCTCTHKNTHTHTHTHACTRHSWRSSSDIITVYRMWEACQAPRTGDWARKWKGPRTISEHCLGILEQCLKPLNAQRACRGHLTHSDTSPWLHVHVLILFLCCTNLVCNSVKTPILPLRIMKLVLSSSHTYFSVYNEVFVFSCNYLIGIAGWEHFCVLSSVASVWHVTASFVTVFLHLHELVCLIDLIGLLWGFKI